MRAFFDIPSLNAEDARRRKLLAIMAVSAMARQLGGLAIDGCIRDSEEIIAMGFPIFARGFCIRGTSKSVPGLVNHPTVFGGIVVQPGDLILGDDDGMVVVARAEAESVLEKALKRMEAEVKKTEQLRSGVSSVELNKLGKVFEALGKDAAAETVKLA